jgi:hypothetical protein
MTTITILDQDSPAGSLLIRLLDLLELGGERSQNSTWRVTAVEATGLDSETLHQAADTGEWIDGNNLLSLARGLDQVVDGRFAAYDRGQSEPWLLLGAVDSTSWDVASDDVALLKEVRSRYHCVAECGNID